MSAIKYIAGLMVSLAVSASSAFAQTGLENEKVLIVVSSLDKKAPDLVGGFWFPELTHPVEVFDNSGLDYDIASPQGGLPPFDGFNLKDQASLDFWTNPEHRNKLANSIKLSDVVSSDYSAILLVGGHGPMWDFVNNPILINTIKTMYERGDIITAVCHGPAGLINVKLSDGKRLIQGRHLTGFTLEEESSRGYDKIVPFELETSLEKAGAVFEKVSMFENKVVVDGRLITGQNPASAKSLGEILVRTLQEKEQL